MIETKEEKEESLTSLTIFVGLGITILFFESIYTLLGSVKRGVRKKEILSKKSNLGFNFEIIIKS